MKKMWSIFRRDLRISSRDFMALWILIAPILIAVVILVISPGINDTALNVALLSDADPAKVEYFKDVAKVTQFDSIEDIEERVSRRDDVVGIVNIGNDTEIIMQGNESKEIEDFAKAINALYDLNAQKSDTRMTIKDFQQTVPPLKKMLASSLLLMVTVLSGMMISLNIVDEKVDETIKASNVTPLTQLSYIFGKSLLGVFSLIFGAVGSLIVLGFWDINWLQMLLILFSASLLSIIIGFAIGLSSSDFVEAAGSLKLLMLPLAGSVLVFELVSAKWQWTVWWSPFYWAYKGADEIINLSADWLSILMYTAIVMLITVLVFILLAPRIRKGLN